MMVSGLRTVALVALLGVVASCGSSTAPPSSGESAAVVVQVAGRVVERGTRGPILVFAYSDLGPNDDPTTHDAASVATLAADGSFDMDVPGSATLALAFLADGSNDGAVDEGDPLAVLRSPELADLQAGDRVHLADVRLDFVAHKVTATVDVTRTGEPPVTPTAIP